MILNEAARYLEQEIGLSTGATEAEIQRLVDAAPFPLPGEYLDCLRACNGVEGPAGTGYLVFWSVEDALEMHASYNFHDFGTQIFLIGGMGGNAVFGVDGRSAETDYVEVDLIGSSNWDEVFFITTSLVEMFKHMATGDE